MPVQPITPACSHESHHRPKPSRPASSWNWASHALSGRREAWDSAEFWIIGLPAALLISAALGFFARRKDWLWTFAIVPAQVTTMMLRRGEIGSLWPLAAALSAILSAPFVFVASRFRRTA